MPLILFDTQVIQDKNTSIAPLFLVFADVEGFSFLTGFPSLKTSISFVVLPKILYPSVNTLTLKYGLF